MHFNKNKAIPAFLFENKDCFHVAHFFSSWSSFTSFIKAVTDFSLKARKYLLWDYSMRGSQSRQPNPSHPPSGSGSGSVTGLWVAGGRVRSEWRLCAESHPVHSTHQLAGDRATTAQWTSHTFVHFRHRQNVKAKAKLFSAWFCKNSHKTNKW